ncbi:signal peptidase I [Chloroflexota bacterium]
MKSFMRDTITIIVLAAVLFLGMQFTVQRFSVDGPSMRVSFYTGQQLMVNKVVYRLHEPERGDVIIFQRPELSDEGYIKRIIGLPGEYVEIKKGVVYIHQQDGTSFPLDEPYISSPAVKEFRGEVIPENEYFVLGDNRINSSDSRDGWTLSGENIIGKVWLSIWPFDLFGLIPNYAYANN